MVVPASFAASTALSETSDRSSTSRSRREASPWSTRTTSPAALARIGADTRGDYLIGFDTAIPPRVRAEEGEVKIRVKRKDLQVRARRDCFGPADADVLPASPPADPLLSAALSPFTTGTLDVRLAALFGHDAAEGDFVRALVAVDPAGITLAEAPGGGREGNLTMLVFALDDEGDVVGQRREVIDVRLDADAYHRARQHGLRYGVHLPFKKAGGYQIRVGRPRRTLPGHWRERAVRRGAARRRQDRIALSGVVLTEADAGEKPLTATFARGSRIQDQGPSTTAGASNGGFSVSATVLRDGKLVYTSPPAPLAGAPRGRGGSGGGPVPRDADAGGRLHARPLHAAGRLMPGHERKKRRPVRQWVDFEVRP